MTPSVSLPEEDVEFIDRHATRHAVGSRSGVVQRAVSLLRASELGEDYAAARDEWESSPEAEACDVTAGDSLSPSG